jgi:DnaJ homologue, subfamily C, member 28, conserved domain
LGRRKVNRWGDIMTTEENKPKGTEEAIRKAIERGEFENLKGKGKPLNLDDYFDTPEDTRIGYSLLKNAGFVPEEVELLNQITEIKARIKETTNESDRKVLYRKLLDVQLKYDLRMERLKK